MSAPKPTREQLIALAKRDPKAIADLALSLWNRVEALAAKVAELQRNSRTSSKPPSSDKGNFANPPKPKSLRRKSGKNRVASPATPAAHEPSPPRPITLRSTAWTARRFA